MASIIDMLGSLTHEDGSPDFIARRQHLDCLLEQLLSSERRYLKARLSAMTRSIDFVPKLPVEILLCVSDYLTVADYSATRRVSKAWLGCFDRSDVVNSMMKKHFRMIYETPAFKTATASARRTMYSALSRRENGIDHGRYHSMTSYSPLNRYGCLTSPIRGGEVPSISEIYFSENRLIWKTHRHEMLCVIDLVSGNAKKFATPDRSRISEFSMHGDSLIATCATNLYGWSLETGDVHSIKLPSMPLMVYAGDGKALISLRDGSVLEWTIGSGVQQRKIPAQPNGSLLFQCYDPISEAAFIRCFWKVVDQDTHEKHGSAPKALRMVAEKLVEERIVSSSYIDIHLSEKGRIAFETSPSETIDSVTKPGCVGLDNSCKFSAIVRSDLTDDCPYTGFDDHRCSSAAVLFFHRITYDAGQGQWQKTSYAVPRQSVLGQSEFKLDLNSLHFTGSQALFAGIYTNGPLAIALRPFSREWLATTTPCWAPDLVASAIYEHGLPYSWVKDCSLTDVNLRSQYEKSPEEHGFRVKIYGNSDFTVLVGLWGFTVWCYDKEIVLPKVLGGWNREYWENNHCLLQDCRTNLLSRALSSTSS